MSLLQRNLGESGHFSIPIPHITVRTVAGSDRDSVEYTDDDLRVRRLTLIQEIGRPGRLSAHLVTDDLQFDVDGLVTADFTLLVRRSELGEERAFRGIVTQVRYLGTFSHQLHLALEAEPALGLGSRSKRTRVFQEMTTPEIVAEVFSEVAVARNRAIVERLTGTYDKRDYCVQYRETDLEFVQRILAEEGIAFTFDHSAPDDGAEKLVLIDANSNYVPLGERHEDCDAEPTLVGVLSGHDDRAYATQGITQLVWTRRPQPHYVESSGVDWKSGAASRIFDEVEATELEPWHCGHYYEHDAVRLGEEVGSSDEPGAPRNPTAVHAGYANDRAGAAAVSAEGRCNVLLMEPGHTISVFDHPFVELDREYLVTATMLTLDDPSVDVVSQGRGGTFDLSFKALPLEVPFRPVRLPPPRIYGPHTATVVGPTSEEIYTDGHGRIKVRFHWDREGEQRGDHLTSCWVRVSQAWCGPGYGSVFVPRVGSEVIIAFEDGDPDRPLCVGCLYNGGVTPTVDLPGSKTKSGIISCSSPGGAGYNEITIDDACGAEKIRIHGEKDWFVTILDSHIENITNDQHVTMTNQVFTAKNDQTFNVKNDQVFNVTSDQTFRIERNNFITVDGRQETTVKRDVLINYEEGHTHNIWGVSNVHVDNFANLYVKEKYNVEAGKQVDLICGESSMTMTPSQIELKVGEDSKVVIGKDGITLDSKQVSIKGSAKIQQNVGDTRVVLEPGSLLAAALKDTSVGSLHLDQDAKLSGANIVLEALINASMDATASVTIGGKAVKVDLKALASLIGQAAIVEIN